MKKSMKILGVNSGTSIDSLDIALFDVDDKNIDIIKGYEYKYPNIFLKKIKELGPTSSILEVENASINLGKFVGQKINTFLKPLKLKPKLIGMHGQTIHHSNNIKNTTTIQITEPDIVSNMTGIDVVSDFRKKDVINGGSGAPFVPILDHFLFKKVKRPFIAQNLGGIANTTLVHKDFNKSIGYDSGPANSLVDKVISIYTDNKLKFDKNGNYSRKGKIDKKLFNKILSNPFFKRKPPKSTGNREFGIQYALDLLSYSKKNNLIIEDILATLTEVTVESIARSYEDFIFKNHKIKNIILSGGGVKNSFMIERLQARLPEIIFLNSDDIGMPSKFKECALFALLAYMRFHNLKINLKNITGAKTDSVLGKLSSK